MKIYLESNTLAFTNDDSEGEFPLIDTLRKIQGTSSITTLVTSAGIPADFPGSLMQYWEIFDMEKVDHLPKHSRYDCGFQTTVELLNINCPLYPHKAEEEAALNTWLDNMLKKGWLFKETSPIASPIVFARKSDVSLHPCIDYGHLNKISVTDPYPLPLEQTISQAIAKSRVFSKLDLMNAFNKI